MALHARYQITNFPWTDADGEPLVIRDVGQDEVHLTVTNDAEHVVAELAHKGLLVTHKCQPRRLLYFDSEGILDELLHDGCGKFLGFAPGPEKKEFTRMRKLTHAEWIAEAEAKFGKDPMRWRFVCPSCGHVASVQDWKDAGATDMEAGFSCVGRHLNANDAQTFKKTGGPCLYAGGGLFKLNPVTVVMRDGYEVQAFEFAE